VPKTKAEWLCWTCVHQRELHGEEEKHRGYSITDIEFYCKVGHSKPNFDCKDFETTRQLVRDTIDNLVE
jgi:hypothetical protein